MVVLLLGASGFLGRHIAAALIEGGHAVIRAARRPPPRTSSPSERWIALDLMDERSPAEWSKLLAGVDATINGIGILRETRVQTFERIHVQGPQALFAACAEAGVRVIQISALGADACSPIAYLRSKGAADAHLLRTVERGVVVRPSLVFGVGGASARLFTRLAALPILPLPHQGAQLVQPIHVEDLAALIRTIAECDAPAQRIVSAVGPRPLTRKELLATLRARMGLPPAWTIAVPSPVMQVIARASGWRRGGLLSSDTIAMLEQGSTGDGRSTEWLLGRPARDPERFIPPMLAPALACVASMHWWMLWLRVAVALTWIVSGVVSLGIYPVEKGYALLSRVGITDAMASLALYGAALLDIALGVATLSMPARRRVYELQAAVVIGYTVVISVSLPELWAHPFGPILKNVPLLVAIGMLRAWDRSWIT